MFSNQLVYFPWLLNVVVADVVGVGAVAVSSNENTPMLPPTHASPDEDDEVVHLHESGIYFSTVSVPSSFVDVSRRLAE